MKKKSENKKHISTRSSKTGNFTVSNNKEVKVSINKKLSPKDEGKIRAGAQDFAIRFEDVMRELANG